MIIEDKPLKAINEDLLQRENLVNLIATSLIDSSKENHSCRCIGIYGKWGEGKTSFMNLVEAKLNEKSLNKIQIIHFNPWMIGGQEALLWNFFNCISSDLESRLKNVIRKYGKVILYVAESAANLFPAKYQGFVSTVISRVKKARETLMGINESLEDKKQGISKNITKSNKHLLVMIDDVDRLNNEEIHALFRLIRQVADFDNTTYMLAMDPDIVAKSLSGYFGIGNIEDGRNFIDKIVQVPLQLPMIPSLTFKQILKEKLSILWNKYNCGSTDDLDTTCNRISKLFTTQRQIVRLLNQLNFILPMLQGEVNSIDLCCLEAIKTIDVQAYRRIYHYQSSLMKEANSTELYFHKKEEEKRVEERYTQALSYIIKDIEEPTKDYLKKIIEDLFNQRVSDSQSLLDKKRICTCTFFSLYFIQDVPQNIISSRELDILNSYMNCVEKVTHWLDEALEKYGYGETQRAIFYVLRKEKDLPICCTLTGQFVKALSYSKAAYGYEYNSMTSSWDISSFICSVLFRIYMIQSRTVEGEYKYDLEGISNVLSEVYETANMQYAMCLQATVSKHFSNFEELNPNHIISLVNRFLSLSYEEQLKYSQFLLVQFFYTWKKCDKTALMNYLVVALKDCQFDTKCFVERMIIKDDRQCLLDFVFLFEENTELVLDRLVTGGVNPDECNSMKMLGFNWKTILQNIRERSLQ